MSTLVTILHVIVAIFLMLTVLLQSGKGGGMGAAFGGGNAATVFGGSGASSFLKKLTAASATIFMLTSITLAFIASHDNADALEKFGKQQDGLRAEKEKATQKALDEAAKNTGSGSAANGSAGSGSAGSNATPVTPEKPSTPDGSNAKSATQDPNPATIPDSMKAATDSNTKPVDTSVTKPDVAPAKPANGPAKTDTKPAEKPAP
jgi:preprotein translocase subunit SecG